MKDFTLTTYRQLLMALKDAGYIFLTFEEWCDTKPQNRFVILRHDVDLKAQHSLATAQIEAELGIQATYYFRVVPQSNQPEIILSIAELGHEIGYHYEDLSLFKGNAEKALEHFKHQLEYFRQFYPVRTICMHGSPTSKYDNRDIWKSYNYRDFEIIGEPYFDILSRLSPDNKKKCEVLYFTDTARMWDGDKFNVRDKNRKQGTENNSRLSPLNSKKIHSSFDLINWISSNSAVNSLMITTHPQRWTENKKEWVTEFLLQNIKNQVKRFLIR